MTACLTRRHHLTSPVKKAAMASRGGPRAAGTDGGDFGHREIIKEQYYVRNGGGGGGYPGGGGGAVYRKSGFSSGGNAMIVNDDPGVNDSGDEAEAFHQDQVYGYSDSQAVLHEISRRAREVREEADAKAQQQQQQQSVVQQQDAALLADLPLTGDYQGLGGPETVPLLSGEGIPFEAPPTEEHRPCILDELFLSPTDGQIRAYKKIERMRENATTKSRLKWSVTCHLLLFLAVCAKLLPEVLDRLDVFVLELEELFVPRAHLWEFLWLLSAPFCLLALSACRRSAVAPITKFAAGTVLLGLLPILIGMGINFADVAAYASSAKKGAAAAEGMATWKGYPIAVLWYAFFLVAVQVHAAELYFARVLIRAWAPKTRKTQ